MPYIKEEDREDLDEHIAAIASIISGEKYEASRAGLLNYAFSSIIGDILKVEGLTYNRANSYIGALECAKMEIYRRVIAPYEDEKMKANGDVF